jgi:hypothetical protein
MRISSKIVTFGMAALLSACASQPEVTTDYDRSANFSQYHTYGFAAEQEGSYQSLTGKYIKSAVSQELEKRGYKPSATPDLLVYSSVNKQDKVRVENNPQPVGVYGMRWGGYAGWAGYNQTAWPYTEGTLTVDLVDRNKKQLVWRGAVSDTLDSDKKSLNQVEIQQAVGQLFAKYPYTASK